MIDRPTTLQELHEITSRPTGAVVESLKNITGNILVIGAGGKMGYHLTAMVDRAIDALPSKPSVLAVSRFGNDRATKLFDESGIKTLSVDLSAPGAVEKLPDAEAIFFLAGVKFGTSQDAERLHQINVELPSRIVKRFPDAKIVALSTGCVYPFVATGQGGSIESDPLGGQGDYAESCIARETAFFDSTVSSALIRLNYSVDLRYGVLVDIAQKVFQEQAVDVSTGHANVIWQGDAIAYTLQALPHIANPPWVLNVTGEQTIVIREVAQKFAELFGKPVVLTGVESETAWLNNAARCHQIFGPPRVNEDQLIEWVADWIKAGGETLNKPTRFEVRDGKY